MTHNRYYNHIIYHKQCLDGFSGLFVAYLAETIDKNTTIFPDVPSATSVPPGIIDKDVLIVDVAYKLDILKEIIRTAKSVTFIDHHVSIRNDVLDFIEDELKEIQKTKYVKIVYNEKMCGATLTWRFLFGPERKIPLFIKYVEDNDTGTWRYDKTIPFIFSLEANYKLIPTISNLEHWKTLLDKYTVFRMHNEGVIIKKYHDNLVERNAKKYSLESFPSKKIFGQFPDHFKKVGQYRVAVFCGMGCPSVTSLGTKLLDVVDCDFVMIWSLNIDRKEYVVSMRSREVDIGSIAKLFGGGGHRLAGAFSFPVSMYSILDLFEKSSLPRKAK